MCSRYFCSSDTALLLGGALLAVYSAFSVDYRDGGGYLVESAPVGLVIGRQFCLCAPVGSAGETAV